MAQKLAIFSETDQSALLGACESDAEFIPIWLMLRCGMHPCDVGAASSKFRFNGQFLEWKRAKNAKPRREMVPDDIRPRLERWLKHGKKLTRFGYFELVRRIGVRVDHPEYTPMTLRHSFAIHELRALNKKKRPPPNIIDLVATKMGCRREVLMQNYLDLLQWEGLGGDEPDES